MTILTLYGNIESIYCLIKGKDLKLLEWRNHVPICIRLWSFFALKGEISLLNDSRKEELMSVLYQRLTKDETCSLLWKKYLLDHYEDFQSGKITVSNIITFLKKKRMESSASNINLVFPSLEIMIFINRITELKLTKEEREFLIKEIKKEVRGLYA